jgi:hypothetical protein
MALNPGGVSAPAYRRGIKESRSISLAHLALN